MRLPLLLALAALPLANAAQAGGIPGITLPHLTWPQEKGPETPTRTCPEGAIISGEIEDLCQPED